MAPRVSMAALLLFALVSGGLPLRAGAGGTLFWYDAAAANRRVRRCDVESCTPAEVVSMLAQAPVGDLAVDPVEGKVYWAHPTGLAIARADIGGGAAEDIFALSSGITGLALDPWSRHVYVATPGTTTRIWRYDIDDPAHPVTFLVFNEPGCTPACSPQGLVLDRANGFLYWADGTTIRRKALALPGSVATVVTGLNASSALALDVAHDRVYFSQASPSRISYALLSNPATVVDLVSPLSTNLVAGGLERDPTVGTLGELYIALSGASEIRHCSLDAGCPTPLLLLTSGMQNDLGLAFIATPRIPALGTGGAALLAALLAVAAAARRAGRRPA